MKLWPHQVSGIKDVADLLLAGERRICLTSPTGGGKSKIMTELMTMPHWKRIVLYTNRKLLHEQIAKTLSAEGINFGRRASGHAPALLEDIQISSTMTENSRVYKKQQWELHNAELVLVDEAHVQSGDVAQKILRDHIEHNAQVVGFTATPVNLRGQYENLVIAGRNSDLRDCGALVPCYTFGPDEPDTQLIHRQKTGEYSYGDVKKVMMTSTIWGRVFETAKILNPDWRPTILFAPGVPESIFFAKQFWKRGIRAAHIDGNDVWVNGDFYRSNPEVRKQVIDGIRSNDIKIVCNRFVLREGIDIPELSHCIFATVFGALSSYIQSGGRLLRSHFSLEHVCVQDHGGNWWRHGSLNSDRPWILGNENRRLACDREDAMREKRIPQPICCPKCKKIRDTGRMCPACGYEAHRGSRLVTQINGTMKEMKGDILKPRRTKMTHNTEWLWENMYYRAKRSSNLMTFRQARGLFFHENMYWPPADLKFMPKERDDWFRSVRYVHIDQLREYSDG